MSRSAAVNRKLTYSGRRTLAGFASWLSYRYKFFWIISILPPLYFLLTIGSIYALSRTHTGKLPQYNSPADGATSSEILKANLVASVATIFIISPLVTLCCVGIPLVFARRFVLAIVMPVLTAVICLSCLYLPVLLPGNIGEWFVD